MNSVHNFLDTQKSYFESRKIDLNTIENLMQSGLLKLKEDCFHLAMKALDGNIVGWQERFLISWEYKGNDGLSKAVRGSKVGYFYQEIDFSLPVIVVQGELDYLAVSSLSNIVGVSSPNQIKNVVDYLRKHNVPEILFLLNNTHQGDVAINKLLMIDNCSNLFDCKELLGSHKDIVSYFVAGNQITKELLNENKNSLDIVKQFTSSFVLDKGKIDHNEFSKYVIDKFNIASTQTNLFIYDYGNKKGIWGSLDKQHVENLVMKQLESLFSYAISHFKIHDLKHTFDFMIANSNSEEIKNSLMSQNEKEINLSDGILEIETMKIRSYTKEDYKFHKLPYLKSVFDIYTEPKLFLNFLDEILEGAKNKESIKSFLQEFIGWLFVPSTKFEKALLLYGSGGNGKGVLLNIIKGVLGSDNCSSIGLHEINKDQYLYNLIGKSANIDSDLQQNTQLDTGIVKKLISGESISAKKMYKNPIEFLPYCRILIAANELPYLKTIDNSIRRRFVFLNLKNNFLGKEDFGLANRILQDKNNIFVWAIEGLKRLLDRGNFDIPEELDQELNEFIKENDTIELFFEDGSIVRDKDAKILHKELYFGYKVFCNECGYKALSQRNFNKRLRDKGFEDFKDGKGRGFVGLRQDKPF